VLWRVVDQLVESARSGEKPIVCLILVKKGVSNVE